MVGGSRVLLVCLFVAALAGLTQPQDTSAAPTIAPSGQRFMSYDQADMMYATLYNGLHCNGDAVGFSIKAHVLNQCLPSNDAARRYHPSVRRCFVGAKKVSIIEDTYADFACSPSAIDARGSMPNAPDGGILYHDDICTKSGRGMPGQSSRASCQLLPSSLASRDMLLVQSFLHATCSGAPTPAGQNPEVMALFLNTCTFFIDADRVKLRRVLAYVSGDGYSSNLILRETRYTHDDTNCLKAPLGDPISVVYKAVDGTGACLPDPLLPKRFYRNALRTTSLVDSAPDWAVLPTWEAPTLFPTPTPTAPSPRPTAIPTSLPTMPTPTPTVIATPSPSATPTQAGAGSITGMWWSVDAANPSSYTGTGSVLRDLVGTNDLTLYGSYSYDDGSLTNGIKAINFLGTGYSQSATFTPSPTISERTSSMWLSMTDNTVRAWGFGLATSPSDNFEVINWNESGQGWCFGSSGFSKSAGCAGGGSAPNSQWIMITAVYSSAAYVMYQNGVVIKTFASPGWLQSWTGSGTVITLGKRTSFQSCAGCENPKARIGEAAMWSRALSASEVASLFVATKAKYLL